MVAPRFEYLSRDPLAFDWLGLVDDQTDWSVGLEPVSRGDGPRLHGSDEVVDLGVRPRPVDPPVLLAEFGAWSPSIDPGEDLGRSRRRAQAIDSATSGAPSLASRSSSSPAVSSGSIGVRAKAIMPPASIFGVIRMTVTPVSVSPRSMALAPAPRLGTPGGSSRGG